MVSDVAAMLVATTTFLTDELGGSNTLFCSSDTKWKEIKIDIRCTLLVKRKIYYHNI